MSLFNVAILGAGVCLLTGVLFIVRGKSLAGILAVVLAIVIAGFGAREYIPGTNDDLIPSPTVTAIVTGTPGP